MRRLAARFRRLYTQSEVVVAPARARPRAPKVGSPASTLLTVKQADELGQRTGRNTRTWRSEHRVRSNSARIVYSDPSPNLPKKARSVFSPGKGGGGQRVARARRGLRGNLLPARIQKARRHVSLSIPRPPSAWPGVRAAHTPLQAYYYFVAIGQMAAMPLANSALASPCAVPCWPSSLYTVCSSIGRQRSALPKKRWMRCVAHCRVDRQYVPASSPHSSAYPASPCADLHRGTIPRRCSFALVHATMATSAGVSERP